MFIKRASKRPAILCALLLALCTLATRPFVEMGQCDDFSYVRSAKALAETGHIVYYGWASAMLGWQLALGALFIKLFGFSFAAVNASVLLVSVATAFFLQRTFVHLGLTETNAAFATLTLVLSPLFIPLSFSFMSDIPGLFALVLCLYMCLRAIESTVPSHTTRWLVAASLANALLGTARQTGWLGVIVIVPSACWIVRRRPLPFALLAGTWILCLGSIYGALHWFSGQMYSTIETSNLIRTDGGHLFEAAQLAALADFTVDHVAGDRHPDQILPSHPANLTKSRARGQGSLLVCIMPVVTGISAFSSSWDSAHDSVAQMAYELACCWRIRGLWVCAPDNSGRTGSTPGV